MGASIESPTSAIDPDTNPASAPQTAVDDRAARRAALTDLAAMIGEEVFY